MGNYKILDCTLRDGGYCNEWKFGKQNTKRIISGLVDAGIDIIECGFITNRVTYNEDITKYTNFAEVSAMLPEKRDGKLFVCMINYGEYDLADIPECSETGLDGLRIAFHKDDMIPALEYCREVRKKGYKVFIQAMVSLNYSDEEFLDLIRRAGDVQPYAFYIVDSFGVMKQKDLTRLFYVVENNLKKGVAIGFHSHNNMQLSFSNAQSLTEIRTARDIIIDSSIYGMGRGAGNLNTELFVEHLNDNIGTAYNLRPLLALIDEILRPFYQQNYWGYSLPNYLSAKHNSHPNYAGYLDSKKTLTVENMDEIFSMMDNAKKANYDKEYIEELYLKYMAAGDANEQHLSEIKERISGKDVLIIAPGSSSNTEKEKILARAAIDNVITISVNFDYSHFDTDFIFVSNLRRFRELSNDKHEKCIITSNISSVDVYLQTKYKDLLNDIEAVRDNAALMLIKYLISLGVKRIFIAGMDGYSSDPTQNFADEKMNFFTKKASFQAMNEGMSTVLREYNGQIDIEFVTTSKYVNI